MAIQQHMGVIKIGYLITVVLLLKGAVCAQERKNSEEVFLSQLLDPASGLLDADEAERLWVSCRLELIGLREDIENLASCFSLDSGSVIKDSSNSHLLSWQNIQKIIGFGHPQLKQRLFDCIRMNNLPFPVSREDVGSDVAHSGYLKSLLFGPDVRKRILGRDLLQSTSAGPAPVPVEAPHVGSPMLAAAPSPDLPESPSPPPRVFRSPAAAPFFPDLGKSNQGPSSVGHPLSDSRLQANDDSNNRKTVVIAVVVTAVVTLIATALLFLCYIKFCRTGAQAGQNDQRPLLSMSMSDYSVGALNYSLGDSVKEDRQSFSIEQKLTSLERKTADSRHASIQESQLVGGTTKSSTESDRASTLNGQGSIPSLKSPPGRLVTTPSVMGSLKPPPGRPDPLPPEPPSFKLSTSNSGKPPPPPPPNPPPAPRPSARPSPPVGGPPPPQPPPPPAPSGIKAGPRPPGPPPPPKTGGGPPRPPPPLAVGSKGARPPSNRPNPPASLGAAVGGNKTKLKPFFWDKVQASPDHSMVWNQIKSGSFQFNEEMIETLFGYSANEKSKGGNKAESSSKERNAPQYIQIIESKKAQNLSILLKALNVTIEEVRDALLEGNELPAEFIQTLLKMAPTTDEELKLRLFNGELSLLGPADRFLKALVDIPFAFKRLEALLFMCTLEEEVTSCKESFATLEVACKELRSSRLFVKLLEAVLKTGNRMNDGTFRGGAQAFKLDTLLKLSDVKGTDGKTTLLNFVVKEIMRTEGLKALKAARENRSFSSIRSEDVFDDTTHDTEEQLEIMGLRVVSRLSSELEGVKKAAVIDADNLTGTVSRLGHSLIKTRDFLNKEVKESGEDNTFYQILQDFVQNSEVEVKALLEEEKRIMELVKNTGDYFHGKSGKDEGLRLFTIVRDFLIMLDKVCREIRSSQSQKKPSKEQKQNSAKSASSSDKQPPSSADKQQPSLDLHQRLFPAIRDRRPESSSSDDES